MRLGLRFRPDRRRWTTVLLFHTGAVLVYRASTRP